MQETRHGKSKEIFHCSGFVVLGSILLVVGIAGLFFPVVPGTLLIIVGAITMVDPQSAWLQRILKRCGVRFRLLEGYLERVSD